jgi:hypothetical protein
MEFDGYKLNKTTGNIITHILTNIGGGTRTLVKKLPLKVVKRSDIDELMYVAIHMHMEAMLGISLCSHIYLKLPKKLCFSYYLLCFLFNNIREQEGGTGSAQKQGVGGGGPNNVYPCE